MEKLVLLQLIVLTEVLVGMEPVNVKLISVTHLVLRPFVPIKWHNLLLVLVRIVLEMTFFTMCARVPTPGLMIHKHIVVMLQNMISFSVLVELNNL
jgi:hypothetical protein